MSADGAQHRPADEPDRHDRQRRLPQIGAEGQARLAAAHVVVVGLGATGSHQAELLARAGVGRLTLVDRDVVELSNLPRQTLYTTDDVERVRPKAEAAAARLAAIDPGLTLEPRVADLDAASVERLVGTADLVVDGTDNVPTRMLLNDLCVRDGRPFIYCGAVGTEGQLLVVRPGGPCLRCYLPELPPPGSLPTCDTAGVLGATVALVGSLAATAALRVLLGDDDVGGEVLVVDGWRGEMRAIELPVDPACPCCGRGETPFLDAPPAAAATRLCGRDAVQLPASGAPVDLPAAAARLADLGDVTTGPYLVRVELPERRVLLFADGRVIVGGTADVSEARSVRARLLGD